MANLVRNATDFGWDTVREDEQKTASGVNALRALAGEIWSKGYHYPLPCSPHRSGCFRE
jgi:hypothetical protein